MNKGVDKRGDGTGCNDQAILEHREIRRRLAHEIDILLDQDNGEPRYFEAPSHYSEQMPIPIEPRIEPIPHGGKRSCSRV